MEYKTIAGILTLLIIISAGTLYIEDRGEKTGCRAGWEYVEQGEYEGQWVCKTQSSARYETCFNIKNSSNTLNYWCEKGLLVRVENDNLKMNYETSDSGRIICTRDACYNEKN
jgi:hypothetical protein